MNQVQNQLTVKNPRISRTSAYCKRNNINEHQFKKAKAWYHSAMQDSNQEKKTFCRTFNFKIFYKNLKKNFKTENPIKI